MNIKRISLLVLLGLLPTARMLCQEMTSNTNVFFRTGQSAIDSCYMDNGRSLSYIVSLLRPAARRDVTSVSIEGYSSPEGNTPLNRKLAFERSLAMREYILSHSSIAKDKIKVTGLGTHWSRLRQFVEADTILPTRDKLLYCIDNVPDRINYATNTSRRKSMMDLGVRTWSYLYRNIFPELRVAKIIVTVNSDSTMVADEPKAQDIVAACGDSVMTDDATAKDVAANDSLCVPDLPCSTREPWLAVKTNLLFDAATALNVELEIPIGRRWSIAAEWIFPWWKNDNGKAGSKRDRFQLLNGNLEGRYWLGDRERHPKLAGWFTGLYAGGGKYDLEHDGKGYQGEFFIAAGLSAGFAHTINRKGTLRMEYSLGVGYLQTDYRKYEAYYGTDEKWHPMRTRSGNYSWIGPTRAKVSLVWLLHHNVRKGGLK